VRSLVTLAFALITASLLQTQSLNLGSESFFYGLGSGGGAVLCRLLRDGDISRPRAQDLIKQVLQRMAADQETPGDGKANIARGFNDVNAQFAACQLRLDP
jgi:hypothetical protein